MKLLAILFTLLLQHNSIVCFLVSPRHQSQLSKTNVSPSQSLLHAAVQKQNNDNGERAVVDRKTFVANIAYLSAFSAMVQPSWSDEDLSMPSPEEQKAAEEAELAARLKRKAELQKKKGSKSDFGTSFKAEQEKKKDLKMTNAERRNALCEDLGRGC